MSTREVTVRIAPVPGKPGACVARYHADLLSATYSVEFHDDVMGGIALHGSAEMLRLKRGLRRVELGPRGPDDPLPLQGGGGSAAHRERESPQPVWSQAG